VFLNALVSLRKGASGRGPILSRKLKPERHRAKDLIFCCIIIIAITVGVNSQIRYFLALIPAKKSSNLQGKRRVIAVVSGILVFLAMAACGTLGYSVFLVALMVILLIGLVFGIGQVIKLHFIDSASVKTYEWLDRSEKVPDEENGPK
jgi:hypothetical protein